MIKLDDAYDENNIFAKILRGEMPNITLYEDDKTLAFMDIMPQAVGHCLVIPKEPAVTFLFIRGWRSGGDGDRQKSRRRRGAGDGCAGLYDGAAQQFYRRSNRAALSHAYSAAP
jgi:hypothetical protein